jgi:integrase
MAARINLTDDSVQRLRPTVGKKYERRDLRLPGFLVRVEASGKKSYYFRYSIGRKVEWFRIGPVAMTVAAARTEAKKLLGLVASGRNPQAERRSAKREGITFGELSERYEKEWSSKRNRSWKQASYLIRAFVLPKWTKLAAASIVRRDVKQLIASITAQQTANQVKAAISAVFKFAVKEEVVAVNPCKGIEDNPTTSRERILSESELPLFWAACDQIHPVKAAALRTVLLTGQRPGEVCHMRWADLKSGWWELPGLPQEGWPGVKNGLSHRVWLPARVRELISGETNVSTDTGVSVASQVRKNASPVTNVTPETTGPRDPVGSFATVTNVPVEGHVFANERGNAYGGLHDAMREISRLCKFNPPVTSHDLRRSFASKVTERGHGIAAMNRLLNHRAKSISTVYDRFDYASQDQAIWEDVVAAILATAVGRQADSVVVGFHRVEQR